MEVTGAISIAVAIALLISSDLGGAVTLIEKLNIAELLGANGDSVKNCTTPLD